jgi:hypothetical protein
MFSCKSDGTRSDSTAKDTASEPAPVVKAVCISNGVAIRAEPKKDGKWISSMMLGEVCNYLGETIADSTDKNQEFYKVELSDGAIVWARSYGLLLDAKPAAIIDQTPVYTRPDLVTKTDKSFGTAEFVVIVGEKDNWIEVVGAEKRKKGWINMDAVSTQSEEVAVATLVHKNLMDKSGNIQTEKISGFLEQLPYKETMLAGYLEDLLNESVETAIEESIYDYEELPAEESGD